VLPGGSVPAATVPSYMVKPLPDRNDSLIFRNYKVNLFYFSNFFFTDNNLMDENFWDRIKKLLNAMDKPDIWLIKNAGLGKTAIINGQTKKTCPSADIAYRCAKVLRTTIEELIDGTAGEQYLREYIREKGWEFSPPEGLADIFNILGQLDDSELRTVAKMIAALHKETPKISLMVQESEPEYAISKVSPPILDTNILPVDFEMVYIPYFGKTAAGNPLDISIPLDEYIPFPRQALKGDPNDYFYLKIQGYSMIDAEISEGDLALIRKAEEPINGEIMLVRYESASTLKRIAIKKGKTYLCWEDGTGKQLPVNSKDFEVQGILAWITKRPKK
jgi:SOS-response transcriptional repressor LexA